MDTLSEKDIFLETERLVLRKIVDEDFNDLCEMLQNPNVMYAWEKTFTDDEVKSWVRRMQEKYIADGYGYFLAIDKDKQNVIGQIGLLKEVIEDKSYVGIAYMLKKQYWHQGYATEGCVAVCDYAFKHLKVDEVIAQIRPENNASIKVAKRLKMCVWGEFYKHYDDKVMKHLIFRLKEHQGEETMQN